ncbi:SHOCT domain-containing protein [Vibrio splendidus]|uniref:SHOCT domain-containing protein n=1 Tax=Vibrio splendidus TaxID=29497 RepID=UPI000C839C17|nr:PH domain-containing protein [Vibrio splendidus]PMN25944.1 hypothetical protein BCT36_11365 [Vibrio splendidus]
MTKESKHVAKFREKHLKPNESVIAWADGYIGEIMGSGDKAQHNGSLVVTETLVAFYRKGFIGEVLETIPLKSITSIERKSTLGHRSIRMHTSHDDLNFKGMGKDDELKIIESIEAGRDAKSESPSQAPESNIDKIKKLAELKDSGVLTLEEFESKKAELLSNI